MAYCHVRIHMKTCQTTAYHVLPNIADVKEAIQPTTLTSKSETTGIIKAYKI